LGVGNAHKWGSQDKRSSLHGGGVRPHHLAGSGNPWWRLWGKLELELPDEEFGGHGVAFRHVNAPNPAVDASATEAELLCDLCDGAAGVKESSDLIEHGLAGSAATAPQPFPLRGL
jgi:hypothetical protein